MCLHITFRKIPYFCKMFKVLHTSILIFAITFSFFSPVMDCYALLYELSGSKPGLENAFSLSSSENNNQLYLIPRNSGSVSHITNKTVIIFKYYFNRLKISGLSLETQIFNIFSKYIYFSKTITQSLPVTARIFPFHNFW